MEISDQQAEAVKFRAAGMGWEEIGERLGVCLDIIESWRREREFSAQVERARLDFLDDQMAKLMALLPTAITKLHEALDGSGDTARMKAIELVSKWTGLASGKMEPAEQAEGGGLVDRLKQNHGQIVATLEQEDSPLDGG